MRVQLTNGGFRFLDDPLTGLLCPAVSEPFGAGKAKAKVNTSRSMILSFCLP